MFGRILVAAMFAISPPTPAQGEESVEFSPDLREGLSLTYDLNLDLLVSQANAAAQEGEDSDDNAQPRRTRGRIVQSARIRFEVKDVDDAGRARINGTFERLTTVWRRGDRQHEFSWKTGQTKEEKKKNGKAQALPIEGKRGDGDGGDKGVGEEKSLSPDPSPNGRGEEERGRPLPQPLLQRGDGAVDAAARFKAAGRALAESTMRLIVSPRGEVVAVRIANAATRIVSETDGLDRSALGMFAPAQAARAIEPIWSADGAGGSSREIGETWRSAQTVPVGLADEFALVTDCALNTVDNGGAKYAGETNVNKSESHQPSATAPKVKILRQKGRVEGVWDIDGGSLRQREATLSLATEWSLDDLGLTQNQRVRTRIERASRRTPK